MSDFNLAAALEKRNALVVHFSHHANMRKGGTFPSDLICAMKNKDEWPLSCCVLWPGHNMQLPGSVGVIFHPLCSNVISVSNSDSGSVTTFDGLEISGGVALTEQSFLNSFEVDGCYNEWRLIGANIGGIFIDNPKGIYAKSSEELQFGNEVITEIVPKKVPFDVIFDFFPNQRIFTMSNSCITELFAPE